MDRMADIHNASLRYLDNDLLAKLVKWDKWESAPRQEVDCVWKWLLESSHANFGDVGRLRIRPNLMSVFVISMVAWVVMLFICVVSFVYIIYYIVHYSFMVKSKSVGLMCYCLTTDVISVLIVMPLTIYSIFGADWILSPFMCYALPPTQRVAVYFTTYMYFVISFDILKDSRDSFGFIRTVPSLCLVIIVLAMSVCTYWPVHEYVTYLSLDHYFDHIKGVGLCVYLISTGSVDANRIALTIFFLLPYLLSVNLIVSARTNYNRRPALDQSNCVENSETCNSYARQSIDAEAQNGTNGTIELNGRNARLWNKINISLSSNTSSNKSQNVKFITNESLSRTAQTMIVGHGLLHLPLHVVLFVSVLVPESNQNSSLWLDNLFTVCVVLSFSARAFCPMMLLRFLRSQVAGLTNDEAGKAKTNLMRQISSGSYLLSNNHGAAYQHVDDDNIPTVTQETEFAADDLEEELSPQHTPVRRATVGESHQHPTNPKSSSRNSGRKNLPKRISLDASSSSSSNAKNNIRLKTQNSKQFSHSSQALCYDYHDVLHPHGSSTLESIVPYQMQYSPFPP